MFKSAVNFHGEDDLLLKCLLRLGLRAFKKEGQTQNDGGGCYSNMDAQEVLY